MSCFRCHPRNKRKSQKLKFCHQRSVTRTYFIFSFLFTTKLQLLGFFHQWYTQAFHIRHITELEEIMVTLKKLPYGDKFSQDVWTLFGHFYQGNYQGEAMVGHFCKITFWTYRPTGHVFFSIFSKTNRPTGCIYLFLQLEYTSKTWCIYFVSTRKVKNIPILV